MFKLDLETLLQVVQSSAETLHLTAQITHKRQRLHIHLMVSEGRVLSCQLFEGPHLKSEGEEALREIHHYGVLDWTLAIKQDPLIAVPLPRTSPILMRATESLPPQMQRQELVMRVFACVDGTRSLAQIQEMLARFASAPEIERIARQMHAAGIITLRSSV